MAKRPLNFILIKSDGFGISVDDVKRALSVRSDKLNGLISARIASACCLFGGCGVTTWAVLRRPDESLPDFRNRMPASMGVIDHISDEYDRDGARYHNVRFAPERRLVAAAMQYILSAFSADGNCGYQPASTESEHFFSHASRGTGPCRGL